MRKRWISGMLVTGLAISMCTGCGGSSKVDDLELKNVSDEKQDDGKVSLTVWGAEADQELLQEIVDSFKEEYKGQAEFDITLGIQEESECKNGILSNINESPDVFSFADDQLRALAAAGVLKPIENGDVIKGASLEGAVEAASINDAMYAYPLTADNGYFLYYNKKYISEEQAGSLNSILEAAAASGKKMTMDWNSGWYLYSFFSNTGMELGLNEDGISNYCTWNNKKGDIKGTDVAESMLDIANSAGFVSADDVALKEGAANGTVIAGVSGVWSGEDMKAIWGKDYAATKLPTYTVAGKEVQMGSYTGYKLVGVNAYSDEKEWAAKLAEWIVSEKNQKLRFEKRGQGPANSNAAASDEVSANIAIKALIEQSEYGSLQRVGGKYWEPATEFGVQMSTGNVGKESLQHVMNQLVKDITARE